MYRYIALVWNPAQERAAAALAGRLTERSAEWSEVLRCPGLLVFHSEPQPGTSDALPVADGAGVVLGRVFTRDLDNPEAAARVSFGQPESDRILASAGRRLMEAYWGRYVAILCRPGTGEVLVLRDPLGGLPCLLTRHEEVSIVCSDIEDCQALGVGPFTVNWSYIAGVVAYPMLQIRATALNEVSEVQPGERLRFSPGSLQRSIEWNPIDLARGSVIENAAEAVAALRATVMSCVHTWAGCYRGIVHNLSGGLDSSIVLSCLAAAPSHPELVCLNYYGLGPNEDERQYARAMAQRVGVQLIEHQLDPRAVRLEELHHLRRTSRPWFYMYEMEHGAFEGDLAGRYGASALFSGAGGDGVFFQARADLAVTDYMFEHGFGEGLLRTAIDAARVSRKSIWPLLVNALRARFLGAQWDPIAVTKPLSRTVVSADLVASVKRDKALAHPWFTPEDIRGVSPGVLWHAMAVSLPAAYYSAFRRGAYPDRILPLLAQPLVELCLRIPTYLLIESGWDRALARRAFERDLPREIIRRRAKGRSDQHVRNIMDANLDFVREFLLDGLLVQRGFLQRAALESYLSRERSPADFQYSEILQEHVCTEAWLRSWLTTSSATAG